MTDTLQVVEIIRRFEQGMTRPFLVRAEDGALYVAKGREARPRGLVAEWLGAALARAVGLVVPDWRLLMVPPELLTAFGREGTALGEDVLFGSLYQHHVQDIAASQIGDVGGDLAALLLAFDWWIENADRSLGAHGGNPNLLWRASDGGLVAIDHNLAFDPDFDEHLFFGSHVFGSHAPALFSDLVRPTELADRFHAAAAQASNHVRSVPETWLTGMLEGAPLDRIELGSLQARLTRRAAGLRTLRR